MQPITGHLSGVLPSLIIAPVTPAAAFLGAAESLLTGVEPLATLPDTAWPLTFLAGQIVECALKAYLAGRGVAEDELRKPPLGHNLLELWSRAASRGLTFAAGNPVWLQRLSDLHSGPYMIRYPMGAHGLVLPQCGEMARDLPLLVQAVRARCT